MNEERLGRQQQLTEGVTLTIDTYTDRMMVSHLRFDAGATAPLHHHPEDEVNVVISGRFECTVDGRKILLNPGDTVHVLADQVHGLHAIEAGVVVSTWSPVRNDLLDIFVRGPGRPVLEG